MSKRNRYKFRNKEAMRNSNESSQQSTSSSTGSASTTSSAPSAIGSSRSNGAFAQHAAEYRTIRNDMIRLVILNGIMLAAVVVLYYANRSSGIVEKLYTQIFH